MKHFKTVALMISGLTLVSSCATILTGTRSSITINGQQEEPVNITTYETTIEQVTLPYVLKVSKKKLREKISVTSEHYIYRDFIPGRKTNPWIIGNIALGGLIGLGVDALTGSFYDAEHKKITLEATPKTDTTPTSPTEGK